MSTNYLSKKECETVVESQLSIKTKIDSKFMMATSAYHKLGDISNTPDESICVVHYETDEYFIGNWVSGFGFIDVCFPKNTTRELTQEEVALYKKKTYTLNGVALGPVIK